MNFPIRITIAALIMTLCFIRGDSAWATGQLAGSLVDDTNGSPVAAATVRLAETSLVTSSDAMGRFSFSELADGEYALEISHVAFEPERLEDIIISHFHGGSVVIRLHPRVWGRESVVVQARDTRIITEQGKPVYQLSIEPGNHSLDQFRDVLAEVPGVRIVDSAAGVQLSLEGCPTGQVVVCLDGVPLNPSGSEGVDLSVIPLAAVTSVELTRGDGKGGVSGNGGGVVNFITEALTHRREVRGGLSTTPAANCGLSMANPRRGFHLDLQIDDGSFRFRDPTAGGESPGRPTMTAMVLTAVCSMVVQPTAGAYCIT